MVSQGAKANIAGQKLENIIEQIFINKDIKYNKQVKFTGIYGNAKSKNRMDFCITLNNKTYGVECKSQSVAGSVDEKIPYVMLNGLAFDSDAFIFVIDGAHFEKKKEIKEGAINFAKKQSKEIYVLNRKEFEEFVANSKMGWWEA